MVSLLFLALIEGMMTKTYKVKGILKRFALRLPVIVAVAAMGMMYWEIPFFNSLEMAVRTFTYAAEAHGYFSPIHAPYASLINTFRILGVWVFPTGYNPYHDLYYFHKLITVTSFLWPVTALGLSLLLADKNRRLKILLLIAVSLVII